MWLVGKSAAKRGQSNPVALILVLAITIASTSAVILFGVTAIENSQEQLTTQGTENAMTQLDSKASLVALGESGTQQVNLGSGNSNPYSVSSDTGWLNISYTNESGKTVVMQTRLGAVTHTSTDDTRIAYQGGGVWRADRFGETRVVSEPEFSYRNRTLTLPVVSINNNATVTGTASVSHNETIRAYPNETLNNPRENATVVVEVRSEFHEGWQTYFEDSTDGSVKHYPDDQRVTLTLTVPVNETFESSVKSTGGSDSLDSGFPSDGKTGSQAPSASYAIDTMIEACTDGGCTPLPSDPSSPLSDDTYYSNGDITLSDAEFDTGSGDIDVVVDGDIDFEGDHDITDSGNVTYYIKGGIGEEGNYEVNRGSASGEPSQLEILVHSHGGDIKISGRSKLTGYLYAPNSTLIISGNGEFAGSAVINEGNTNGNPSRYAYDSTPNYSLDFIGLPATYLHVSDNSINVTDR